MPPVVISLAGRRVAGVVASIGWVALELQLIVSVGVMTAAGRTLLSAVWNSLTFFTILTNLLVAITLTRVARHTWPGGAAPNHSAITGVVLVIAIVGVAYCTLLAGPLPAMGPLWWTADRMLHYLIPAATMLWWLAFVPAHAHLPRPAGVADLSCKLPGLRARAVDGWSPYFFIDVGAIGYGRALVNAVLLSAAMLVAGLVLVAAVRTLRQG